jgi:Rieske Fe-S protein
MLVTGLGAIYDVAMRFESQSQQASTISLIPSSAPTSSSQQTSVAQGTSRQTSQTTTKTTSQSSSQSVPSGYVFLAPLSAVSGMPSAYFNHPKYGSAILINDGGQWRAFSAVCTHAGCTVQFTGPSLYCPCHAGYFSPVNGSVQSGPPPTPLGEFGIIVSGGNIYVSEGIVN